MRAFMEEVNGFTKKHMDSEDMQPYTKPLRDGVKKLEASTMWLMQNGMQNPNNAGAASMDFMHLFGLVALGYMWGLMAEKSQQALAEGANGSTEFHENKLMTARYFMERVMPESAAHLARIESGCAQACYNSDEYSQAKQHRRAVSKATIILVDGFDG